MLYMLGRDYSLINNAINTYRFFETHTESVLVIDMRLAEELAKQYGFDIKNMNVINNKLEIKDWVKPFIAQRGDHENLNKLLLLTKINEDKFKITDNHGSVNHLRANELKQRIEGNQMINCDTIETKGITTHRSTDTYTTKTESKFEHYIDKKYTEFRAKSLILGKDISFDYIIEGNEVKLMRYTGTCKQVIIPNFITTINKYAFQNRRLTELALNQNLKYIGSFAFDKNKLSEIVIPQSVKFIGQEAFSIPQDKIRLLNKNTLMIPNVDII